MNRPHRHACREDCHVLFLRILLHTACSSPSQHFTSPVTLEKNRDWKDTSPSIHSLRCGAQMSHDCTSVDIYMQSARIRASVSPFSLRLPCQVSCKNACSPCCEHCMQKPAGPQREPAAVQSAETRAGRVLRWSAAPKCSDHCPFILGLLGAAGQKKCAPACQRSAERPDSQKPGTDVSKPAES